MDTCRWNYYWFTALHSKTLWLSQKWFCNSVKDLGVLLLTDTCLFANIFVQTWSLCIKNCFPRMMKLLGETLKSILNWTFGIIGVYLIGREFYSFIFIQPTTLEVTTAKMSSKFLPEILLCPEPTFILDAVIESGFKGL